MFKGIKNVRGQGVIVPYTMVFVIVTAMIAAMTVYIQRAVQSRIYAVQKHVISEARDDLFGDAQYNLIGNIAYEYEPYYVRRVTLQDVARSVADKHYLSIVSQELDQNIKVDMFSNQIPAHYAD